MRGLMVVVVLGAACTGRGGGAVGSDGGGGGARDAGVAPADGRPDGGADAAPDASPLSACPPANGTVTLDVAAGLVAVRGRITVRGAPGPSGAGGSLWLFEPGRGDLLQLGGTNDASYTAQASPGTYDVLYSSSGGGTSVPLNSYAVLEHDVVIDRATTLDLDVPAVRLSGRVTLAGAPWPVLKLGAALELEAGGNRSFVGLIGLYGDTFDVLVVPGEYDLLASLAPSAGNNRSVVRHLDLTADTVLVLDIQSAKLDLNVTLNGRPATDDVQVVLINARKEEATVGPRASLDVMPGTYDVVARGTDFRQVLATGVAISPPGLQLTFDAKVVYYDVSGLITLNGLAATLQGNLEAVGENGTVVLGRVERGSYQARLAAGRHSLFYSNYELGAEILNGRANVGELVVNGPTIHDVDLRTAPAGVRVLIGGGTAIPTFWSQPALLLGGSVYARVPVAALASGLVIPADYAQVSLGSFVDGNTWNTVRLPGPVSLGKGPVDLVVPAVPVDVRFTVTGQAPPLNDPRRVIVRSRDGAVDLDLGPLGSGGRHDAVLPPATYDAYFDVGNDFLGNSLRETRRTVGCFTVP